MDNEKKSGPRRPPPPERTVKGSAPLSSVFATKTAPADWGTWRHIADCELWEAVSLSIGIEPQDNLCGISGRWTANLPKAPHMPPEFIARLRIIQSNTGCDKPIHHLEKHLPISATSKVRISDVAAFLAHAGLDIPDPMRELAATAEQTAACKQRQQEGDAAPAETRERRQDRRLARYLELNGEVKVGRDGAVSLVGRRGALADLAREEKANGHPYSDPSDVSKELKAAARREHDAVRSGEKPRP